VLLARAGAGDAVSAAALEDLLGSPSLADATLLYYDAIRSEGNWLAATGLGGREYVLQPDEEVVLSGPSKLRDFTLRARAGLGAWMAPPRLVVADPRVSLSGVVLRGVRLVNLTGREVRGVEAR